MSTSNPDDTLAELRRFLTGASKSGKSYDLDLTRTALGLLKTLPASRDAVLEYFCIVFEAAVRKYSLQTESEKRDSDPQTLSASKEEDLIISEIHYVLCNFVTSNPQAWGPIISSWSLKLLGQLSSQFCPPYGTNVDLNEILHWWMSCKAARTLVDIVTQCFQCLIDTDTESCVSALLDTSVAYSHFDWVVAHVGSCFSKTIITRILSLGLKDLCLKGWSSKSAKRKSVVGILDHLGSSHFIDIRSVLLELFKWAFEDGGDEENMKCKAAVVPYLLLLASKSATILRALSADVLQTLSISIMEKILEWSPSWLRYFRDDIERFEDLVVSLALRCEHGGAKIVTLLLEGINYADSKVSIVSRVLIELLLHQVDMELKKKTASAAVGTIPFVDSVREEMQELLHFLLSDNKVHRNLVCRLFRLLGIRNVSSLISAVSYILLRANKLEQLSIALQLVALNQNLLSLTIGDKSVFALAIEQAIRHSKAMSPENSQLWRNLTTLLCKCDKENLKIARQAIVANLLVISESLFSCTCEEVRHAMAIVCHSLPTESFNNLPIKLSLRLTGIVCDYFFICIEAQDDPLLIVNCRRACDLLTNLCVHSTICRSLALRKLLESGLFLSPSRLFGSKRTPIEHFVLDRDYLLSEENYKVGVTAILARKRSNTFGNFANTSVKSMFNEENLSESVTGRNILLLIEALKACCLVECNLLPLATNFDQPTKLSVDGLIQVALLMVELISPDIMYNGLPWPEEEFQKLTVERDMIIRKVFDDMPLAWHLLELVARHEPALCYCSVLLRALLASAMAQWTARAPLPVVPRPLSFPLSSLHYTTAKLLNVMAIGQLLPPPLNSLHEVILPEDNPSAGVVVSPAAACEILTLLRDSVWNYMRDHVPSPALFTQDPRSGYMWRDLSNNRPSHIYTQTFRLILLKNIDSFGHLLSSLFIRFPNSFS